MAEVHVYAERAIAAPPDVVYGVLADYRKHHPRILPPAFSNFQVEQGGVGEGTVVQFRLSVGKRTWDYRMKVSEPEPGRVLLERSTSSSLETVFTVTPRPGGCLVRIDTRWEGARGFGGLMERLFAPRMLRPLYEDELVRLEAYAKELSQRRKAEDTDPER